MTVSELKEQITSRYIADPSVIAKYGLTEGKTFEEQFSPVSLENILFYIQAFVAWTLLKLFELHKMEVDNTIATMKPHSVRWYAAKVKTFQYGDNLDYDTDEYDNAGKTDEEIQASKIIAYSAVTSADGLLTIKVAKFTNDLTQLDSTEKIALTEFVNRVKDAGVETEIVSERADGLRLILDIYYNPLVLNGNGQRLDGASLTPVPDAIREYLKNMPFNGELVIAYLVDALQAVDGVVIPNVQKSEYSYGNTGWLNIGVKYLPFAGYLRIADSDLTINYIPQSAIR